MVTLETVGRRTARDGILIRFSTPDTEAGHAALQAAGVDVDDILGWSGTPAMFAFHDPDGNAVPLIETA